MHTKVTEITWQIQAFKILKNILIQKYIIFQDSFFHSIDRDTANKHINHNKG